MVGAWDGSPTGAITYGTVMDASGMVLFGGYDIWSWGKSSEGTDLATLLANYNAKTAGDTSGTLGDWMASVGFIDNADPTKGPLGNPRFKIILTGQDYNTHEHSIPDGTRLICLMDTNIHRSDSEQPWCPSGSREFVRSIALLERQNINCPNECTSYEGATFTASSAAPGFYTAQVAVDGGEFNADWLTPPGWVTSVNSQQFHWPSFAIQDLPSDWCTDTWNGTHPQDATNPGGVLTMCGPDLEAWLELELPKPPVSSSMASADTTLYRGRARPQ
jgi:hypothetical protein